MRTKLGFGVGSIGESAITIAFTTWNVLFYQNVLGLPGKLAGAAGFIALLVDAVFDPIVGSFSDNVRTRLGRRHPFLYAAPIPLALCFALIYMPPAGLSQMQLFAWLTVFAILQRQAMTLYQVPHLSLGAELSDDYRERSIVMSYNTVFAVVGGTSAAIYGWSRIRGAGGPAVADGYMSMAISVSLFAATAIFLSAVTTHDRIPYLRRPHHDAPRFGLMQLVRDVKVCFGNYNYRVMLLGLLLLSITTGTREVLQPYTGLFFWQLDERALGGLAIAAVPAFFVGFFLTVRLHDKLDKRKTIIVAMCIIMAAATLPVPMGLVGLMPAKSTFALFLALFGFVFTFFLGVAILMITLLSAIADIVDEHELNTGSRQEGIFFASRTFFMKMTTALGIGVSGLVIDFVGFPTGAKPGHVPEHIVNKLALFEGPGMTIFAILATVCYSRYRIDRERHREIREALAARRASSAPPATEAAQAAAISPEPAAG
jgi:Na+/melibiose symporter-like transporter